MPTHHQKILQDAPRDQFRLAGTGLFAQVFYVVGTEIALKVYDEPDEAYTVEKRVYERLGSHPFILQTFSEGTSELGKGLVLQYLPAGTLEKNLDSERFPEARQYWPIQAVEAIRYIHSKGVVHCDIGVHNFLVQKDGSLALSDFSGSSIDGSSSIAAPSVRYTRPLALIDPSSKLNEIDDIFALGTVLYEIIAGHRLYAEKDNNEIRELLRNSRFPDLSAFVDPFSSIISGCWTDRYKSAADIKSDLMQDRAFWLSFGILLVLVLMRRRCFGVPNV